MKQSQTHSTPAKMKQHRERLAVVKNDPKGMRLWKHCIVNECGVRVGKFKDWKKHMMNYHPELG